MEGTPLFAGDPVDLSTIGSSLAANGTRGVLVLHHNNVVEQQAQVIPVAVASRPSYHIYLPVMAQHRR